jgi:hypothetical protein
MGIQFHTLLAAALLALTLPCVAQELDRFSVTMKPFDTSGQVDPEFAETLSRQLMRAIEETSDFRIVPGGPTRYYLKGRVFADEKRHFVSLELHEAQTGRVHWLENYDYRSITPEMMAEDVVEELTAALRSDAWP